MRSSAFELNLLQILTSRIDPKSNKDLRIMEKYSTHLYFIYVGSGQVRGQNLKNGPISMKISGYMQLLT